MSVPEDAYKYLAEAYEDGEEEEYEEEEPPFISIFDILDAPRELPEPVDLTLEHLKQISNELGLIKLCWPDIKQPEFEGRIHFPESYLKNNDKERLLLLYAENFRRQFCQKFPHRKQLFLAADNECGMQKMVCTTIRPTTAQHPEIETWQDCASFVGNHIKFEPLKVPVLIPDRLYSPHTTVLRQSGTSFEIATVLCSLLIGLRYDAYVVSGYATQDVTSQTMCRIDCPYPPEEEGGAEAAGDDAEKKYVVKPPRDLRSKFLQMMEQREVDKIKDEERRLAEEERHRREVEERPPIDELEGLRVHGWVLLLSNGRDVEKSVFIEPSTGIIYQFDTHAYYGIESVWNHLNYWVNMQDCSEGLDKIDYDLSNVKNWEHLLVGEPIEWRQEGEEYAGMDEDDLLRARVYGEKHLDMPIPWSMRINITHEALKKLFPDGVKKTWYKRTLVEEFAPYVQDDGLVKEISRFSDFDCCNIELVESHYENRQDKLYKVLHDVKTDWLTEYFHPRRDDSVIKHQYHSGDLSPEAERIIEFDHTARYDGLAKIEVKPEFMAAHYIDREDRVYYRDVTYAKRGHPPPGMQETHRRIILHITEKFSRDPSKPPSDDIAIREFEVYRRVVNLRFHYGEGKVTASTRQFLKPPVAEMGERLKFNADLTSGYQAEVDAKPPRKLKLFMLMQQQLVDEEKSLSNVKEIEAQVQEFLLLRDREVILHKLVVPLFNREQNVEYREGMLEKEKQAREQREKEVEEESGYLEHYLIRLGSPQKLSYTQAAKIKAQALEEFKQLLIKRANDVQRQFEENLHTLQEQKKWYLLNQDAISNEEEVRYFEEQHDLQLLLKTLEMRLVRYKALSGPRYQVMVSYLDNHPLLRILHQ